MIKGIMDLFNSNILLLLISIILLIHKVSSTILQDVKFTLNLNLIK